MTQTNFDQLNIDEATAHLVTCSARAIRPYPPANVKINGEYYPAEIETDLILTWVDRNRLQQTGGDPLSYFDDGLTAEINTLYQLILIERDENNIELRTQNLSIGAVNTFTFATSAMHVNTRTIQVILRSLRDGYESYQAFDYTVELSQFFSAPHDLKVEFKNDETNRLELNWKLDGFVDEQRYYCSETPFTAETKPAPKVVLANDVRTYSDTTVEIGKTYYVAVGSVKNSVEKLSDIKIVASEKLLIFMPLVADLSNSGSLSTTPTTNTSVFDANKGLLFSDKAHYLSIANAVIDFNQDFKISFEITPTSFSNINSSYGEILDNSIAKWDSSTRNFSASIAHISTFNPIGSVEVGVSNVYAQATSQTLSLNTTTKVIIQRVSGILSVYFDDILVAQINDTTVVTQTNVLRLGSRINTNNSFAGYIKNLKVYDLT